MTQDQTLHPVRSYYASWNHGGSCDEAKLRGALAPDVTFESPSGTKHGIEQILPGLRRFASTLKKQTLLQLIASGNEAAALYDCELSEPTNTLRCAEHFRVENGRIVSIRLVYDATAYRLKAA
jgi:ketosteroid isomerase-like protein